MDPFSIDPELIENDKVRITEDENGNLALEHKSSGRVLTLDQDITISDVADGDDIAAAVDDHQQNDVHSETQPPQTHGNATHEKDYYSEGDDAVLNSAEIGEGSIESEPTESTDVVRKEELDQKASNPHNNAEHSVAFISDGDGNERQVWIIASGASDPASAGPEDIILEEES